jgi:hypothetical protein
MFFFLFFLAQIHIGVMTGAPPGFRPCWMDSAHDCDSYVFSESNKVIGLQVSMRDFMIFIYPSNNGPPSTISSILLHYFTEIRIDPYVSWTVLGIANAIFAYVIKDYEHTYHTLRVGLHWPILKRLTRSKYTGMHFPLRMGATWIETLD